MLVRCIQCFFVCLYPCYHLHLSAPLDRQNCSTCSISSPWMLTLIGFSMVFSITIVLVFTAFFIRPNLLVVSSICAVIRCGSSEEANVVSKSVIYSPAIHLI